MSEEGNNHDEDQDAFSGDYITDEEMIHNFDSYFSNLDGQGQRTDVVPETSRDLTLASQTVSPSNIRGESGGGFGFDESSNNHNEPISSNSDTITVDIGYFQAFPEFVEAAAALLVARNTNRSNNTTSSSHDFAVPNSPYSSFGYGSSSGHSSHSLNEESINFRSQDSYSGMNIDSPAGSQPQSFGSIPIQDSGSQLSQNVRLGDFDPYLQNVPTNIQVQQTLNLFDYQDGDNMQM